MTTSEAAAMLQSLEESWFDSERAARAALFEIKRLENAESPAMIEEAARRFDAAQQRKKTIMSEIETLEDALLV
jgi:hypothetical protein